jgi:hypothetical protein
MGVHNLHDMFWTDKGGSDPVLMSIRNAQKEGMNRFWEARDKEAAAKEETTA